MKMDKPRFNLPLVFHQRYVETLASRAGRIHSVHFSLHSSLAHDARHASRPIAPAAMLAMLAELPGPRKHALLNSRLHEPTLYHDKDRLLQLCVLLDVLLQADALHGVVFVDLYLLQALADASPEICASLEAIPSVNWMIDSPAKARVALDAVAATCFRPPSVLIPDRSLNRDLGRLRLLAEWLRAERPGMRLELLANEGCLLHCPYKLAHDGHIALVNMGFTSEYGFAVNRDLGCSRAYFSRPAELLKSPFIRPEDLGLYEGLVDGFKLCGRTRQIEELMRTVEAYLAGEFSGNLLELMDSMDGLAGRLRLDNRALPADFGRTVASCDKNCPACGYCDGLAQGLCHVQKPAVSAMPRGADR